MLEIAIISALHFSVLLLIDFQSCYSSPHFLALLKFYHIQIGFTKGFFSSVYSIFCLGTLLTFSEVLEVLLSFHISDVHSQLCVLASSGKTKYVDGSLGDSEHQSLRTVTPEQRRALKKGNRVFKIVANLPGW